MGPYPGLLTKFSELVLVPRKDYGKIKYFEEKQMATNTGEGHRKGAVGSKERGDPRSQVETPSGYRKRDGETGQFIDGKKDGTPFKGVRKEKSS